MTNVPRDPQKPAYGDSGGSTIFIYIKVLFVFLPRSILTGCSQGPTKISWQLDLRTTRDGVLHVGQALVLLLRGKHRITSLHWATVDSLDRLNVETPHPYTCLHSPKIANNVLPSSGKHSANVIPRQHSDTDRGTTGGTSMKLQLGHYEPPCYNPLSLRR